MNGMRGIILALMGFTYLGHWPLQLLTGIDATLLYYVFRGALGVALFWALRNLEDLTSWRVLCYGGMMFEGSTVIGGIGYHFDKRLPDLWQGLVDIQTGLPAYWIGVAALIFIAGAIEYESRGKS
jgi:hypothetical protein